MSQQRYIHAKTINGTEDISFLLATPKRTKWGGGNPRRVEIDPSLRNGLRSRKRLGESHVDYFHDQASAASTHPVAKVSATLADGVTTITKSSIVAGGK